MLRPVLNSVWRDCTKVILGVSLSLAWNVPIYILRSGDTWYKREINNAEGYFKLWYSSNAGVDYEELMNLDLAEDSVIIDLTHIYVHTIVGTSYHVSTSAGELLYNT